MERAKSKKLANSAEYRRAFAVGKMVAGGRLRLKLAPAQDAATGARYGLAVGKRVGGAVVRNRVKRRLREQMRKIEITGAWDVVVIAGPQAADARSSELAADLRRLLRKAGVAHE